MTKAVMLRQCVACTNSAFLSNASYNLYKRRTKLHKYLYTCLLKLLVQKCGYFLWKKAVIWFACLAYAHCFTDIGVCAYTCKSISTNYMYNMVSMCMYVFTCMQSVRISYLSKHMCRYLHNNHSSPKPPSAAHNSAAPRRRWGLGTEQHRCWNGKTSGCGWEQRRGGWALSPASSAVRGGVRQGGGASSRERRLNPLKQKLSELTWDFTILNSKEWNFTMLSTLLPAIGRPKAERSFQSILFIGQELHLAVWLLR